MRSFLSKFCGMFLAGALFAVAGCTDYDEDIREINNKLDNEVAVSISNLDDAIKNLEAKMQSDYALKSEVSALKSSLETKINDEVVKLNASIANLQKSLDDLASKAATKDELNSAKTELQSKIDKAVADANAAISALSGEIAKLKTDKADKTYVDELVDGLDKKISNLSDALTELSGTVESNTSDISDLKTAVGDLKEADIVLDAAIEAVADRCTEIEGRLDTDEEKIKSLISDLSSLKERVAQNEKDIATNAAAIKALVDADLITRVGTLETNLSDHIAEYNKHIEAYKVAIKDLQDEDTRLSGLIDALGGRVEELETSVGELQDELDALTVAVSGIRSDLDDLAAKSATKDELAAAKKELEDKLSALDTRMTAAENSLKTVIGRVDALDVDVDKLLSRIQSLVYIPDYSDGKADINVLLLENKDVAELSEQDGVAYVDHSFIEGTSVLRYKVSPAKYAADLATVAAEVFSYDLREVKIRTRAAAVPEMTVVSAECVDAASGEIAVTVKTRNFGDAFYAGENSYSASLVLVQENEEESRNISSEFTNLVPAVETVEFKIFDANEENDLTNVLVEEALEFPYNSRLSQDVLKGHHPVFVLGNEEKTPAEMAELGYEIALEQVEEGIETPADNGVATDEVAEPDGCFVFTTKEDPRSDYMEVKLADKVGKDNIGHTGRVTYTYSVNGVEFFTAQKFVITKEKATVKADDVTINWTYIPDAQVDADKLANVATAQYSRVIALDELTKDGVPADIEPVLYDILTGAAKISINGSEVVGTTLPVAKLEKVVDGENSSLVLHFDGFDWGTQEKPKEYNVKFEVTTDDIDITFTVNITTVDRNREPLTVAIKPATEAEYVKNVVIRRGEYKYSMELVFDALVENENLGAGDMTAADYLKEIFATEGHDNTNIINTIYGKQRGAGLAFVIGEDSYEISPEYNYAWFNTPEVETVVPLTKTFTTWYGQVITIEHTLNFTLPVYDFEHVPAWVKKNEGSSDYYSRVMGKYAPGVESPAVSSFSVTDIDLDAAFDVIDAEGARLDTDALAELGLVTEFEIETENHGTGIVMTDNVLSYNDKDAFVDVKGNLYLVNDNDTRVQLPTNFDAGNKYYSYVVKKYDPIGTPVLNGEAPKIDVVDSKVYTVNMLDYITLKDNRDGRAAYDLIVDGKWLTGNGENGYAAVDVTLLYGLEINYSAVQDDIPVAVRKFFNFNEETGVLTFDASDNLTLVNEIVVPVKMTVDYTWGSKEIEFDVTFFRSNGDPIK
ncbi:MAG: hypothetical protein ACI3ZO_03705 [Candidatus Cryptobacteroides sp.]